MKKNYILFCMLLSFFAKAQIVTVPDANFKAALIAASTSNIFARDINGSFMQIDTNLDGEIQQTEALLVKELIVNNLSISDLTGVAYFSNLTLLFCSGNQLTTLDVSNLTKLIHLNCNDNNLQNLDISTTKVRYVNCSNNPLMETLIIKNGIINAGPPNPPGTMPTSATLLNTYTNLPNISFICVDEIEAVQIKNIANSNGYTCEVNSYCSFVPGGIFYSINGTNKVDFENNGCDPNDGKFPNFKFHITNGNAQSYIIPDTSGDYNLSVGSGTHILEPVLENPNYFTVSPSNVSVIFPAAGSPFNQNFCITPNGSYSDIDVAILPLEIARPGFDTKYKILYRNKGTVSLSGTLYFSFQEDTIDFVASSVSPGLITSGALAYIYTNLQPFQTESIIVTLNLNTPNEIPAVNGGDVLTFGIHAPSVPDETQQDNFFSLQQTVLNSFDPNDKTCLEGKTITPEMVGKYVHYMIRFENTGTANAVNIVVKDNIDTTKFDIATLVPLDGSHQFTTRLTNTNRVEFIFENIQLPFDNANNDGYVSFKIKTMPTLVAGDSFSNTASIYFDYNAPIVTDPAVTTVQILGKNDFDFGSYFSLYPNPVSSHLTIGLKKQIDVKSISIYTILGQLVFSVSNPGKDPVIDLGKLSAGNYILKIQSDNGVSNAKFIKN